MTDDRTYPDGIAAAIGAGQVISTPKPGNPDIPEFVVVPEGSQLVELDKSKWREHPVRATGTAHPGTVAALIDYVKRHEHSGTTVWCDLQEGTLTAVIDDHEPEVPGYGQHRAVCTLEPTPEWEHWIGKNGQSMSQVDFAEHVEVGLDDIVEPTAADVLEMAQFFQANTEVAFRSSNRLQSGEQQLKYDETVAATAGKDGSIAIPSGFTLGIEPFYGEARYKVYARFRFRINGGRLQMSYHLDRPDVVRRQALEAIVDRLGSGTFTAAKVFVGKPR